MEVGFKPGAPQCSNQKTQLRNGIFGHYHDDRSFKYNDMLATMVYRKFVIV